MVAHWQMCVVWLKSVVWPSEEAANIEGVILAGIEVGVIANLHWHMQCDLVKLNQALTLKTFVVLQDICMGCVLRKHVLEELPY